MREPRNPVVLPPLDAETKQRLRTVRDKIRATDTMLREKHSWLKYQDRLGLASLIIPIIILLVNAVLYFQGQVTVLWVIISGAIACSILHELEHDLIHNLYFKNNDRLYRAAMWLVWIFKPNTVAPWYRKKIHLHHHRFSGTRDDIEERLLGNGFAYNWKRLIMTLEPALGVSVYKKEIHRIPSYSAKHFGYYFLPLYAIYFLITAATLTIAVLHLISLALSASVGFELAFLDNWFFHAILSIGVVWALPNFLRAVSLYFITSSMHYHGDVSNPLQETQVLTPWYLMPLQLFCFNFGGTHCIHHLVVGQPYYLRQMSAPYVYDTMRDNGIRFNDTGTFKRNNRWGDDPNAELY